MSLIIGAEKIKSFRHKAGPTPCFFYALWYSYTKSLYLLVKHG